MQLRDKLEQLIIEMLDGHILLPEAAAEFEKLYITKALERNGNHISKTAEMLGIHRNTIAKKTTEKPVPKPIVRKKKTRK
jgi:DNA-binding NtrC family response regulator